MKKSRRHDNRRKKKTVAERKEARARSERRADAEFAAFLAERALYGDERSFLIEGLEPIRSTVEQDVLAYNPDADDDAFLLAVDLIYDNGDEADPIAAAINAIYHDGPEAALPHLSRAIGWRIGFDAENRY